jgi:intracellular septation protein
MTTADSPPEHRQLSPLLKLAFELGPLALFFFANGRYGIFVATEVFMVAVVASLAANWLMARRLAIMPLVSGVVVLVFGTLTVVLQDDLFIKLKPTIINVLFGTLLLGGLAFGKQLLALVFDGVVSLTEEGWKKLTVRWAVFFFALAILNEVVWRTQTTDFWVSFKVFGILPITLVFSAMQYPLMMRYAVNKPKA